MVAWTLSSLALMRVVEDAEDTPVLRGGVKETTPGHQLAFLFLVRSEITTAPIWEAFFRDAKQYRIYTHPKPGFTYKKPSIFAGTEIKNRTKVSWGALTVAQGEILLMRAALGDQRNHRFLLLSEHCVPLHPFRCVYDFLMSAPPMVATWRTQDRQQLYDFGVLDAVLKKRFWRKGHQWLCVGRSEVSAVAETNDWYNTFFQAHAATPIAAEFRRQFRRKYPKSNGFHDPDAIHHNFADEHYVQTVLAVHGLETNLLPASPTFIRFGSPDKQPPHATRRRLLGVVHDDPPHVVPSSQRRRRRRPRRSLLRKGENTTSPPKKAELNISQEMKDDWRATTYQARHIGPDLFQEARALCNFSRSGSPRASAEDDPRGPDRFGIAPWDPDMSQPACQFAYGQPTLCYVLLRKIPSTTVSAYLDYLWGPSSSSR